MKLMSPEVEPPRCGLTMIHWILFLAGALAVGVPLSMGCDHWRDRAAHERDRADAEHAKHVAERQRANGLDLELLRDRPGDGHTFSASGDDHAGRIRFANRWRTIPYCAFIATASEIVFTCAEPDDGRGVVVTSPGVFDSGSTLEYTSAPRVYSSILSVSGSTTIGGTP